MSDSPLCEAGMPIVAGRPGREAAPMTMAPYEIREACEAAGLLARHGGPIEVRILNTPKGTLSGYFDDLDALVPEQADGAGTRYTGEEGTVRGGRDDLTVLHEKDVRAGCLGDIAQHVAYDSVIEAARLRLKK